MRAIRVTHFLPNGTIGTFDLTTDKQVILDGGTTQPTPLLGTGVIYLNHALVLMVQLDVPEATEPTPEGTD